MRSHVGWEEQDVKPEGEALVVIIWEEVNLGIVEQEDAVNIVAPLLPVMWNEDFPKPPLGHSNFKAGILLVGAGQWSLVVIIQRVKAMGPLG